MADFVFLYPAWLLALLPLLLFLPWLKNRAQRSLLIAPHLATLFSKANAKPKTRLLWFLALGWILAVIALAAPSFKKQDVPASSIAITFLL